MFFYFTLHIHTKQPEPSRAGAPFRRQCVHVNTGLAVLADIATHFPAGKINQECLMMPDFSKCFSPFFIYAVKCCNSEHFMGIIWMNIRIPVLLRDSIQAAKHDGENLVDVLLDEAENVVIVPEVQSALCYL